MKTAIRFRFWLEATMATITGIMLVLTLLWEDWVEAIFGISPDGGSGSFERWLVVALCVATIALFAMARSEWRRARASMSAA
jgi:hypothetical protein